MKNLSAKLQEVYLFLKQDYDQPSTSTRRNVLPKKWGPSAWRFIDNIIKGYPTKANISEQKQMVAFLVSLANALPCQKCRRDYLTYINKYPPSNSVKGKYTLKQWFQMYKKYFAKS